jgi:hypothetical protein
MALLTWIWNGLRQLVGLVLPFFARARDFSGMGKALRWAIHIFLVVAILVGLCFLQQLPVVRHNLRGPLPIVQDLWLPLLFVLIYLASWVGWWAWRALQADDGPGFPDLDAAWDEALAALHQQAIDITEAPLFLVLGRTAGGEPAFFESTQISLTVPGAPGRSDAPMHLYGNRDALFLTCAGASLSGRQAAILAEEGSSNYGTGDPIESSPSTGAVDDADKSIGMFSMGMPNGLQEVRALFQQAQREGRALSEAEKQRMDQLMGKTGAGRTKRSRPQLLRNMEESARHSARLEHLCRLVVRDRRPYCSINGVLALVPFAATDSDDDATQTGDIFRRDLDTIRHGAKVDCPLFTLLTDLERVPGFTELIECFPKDQRQRRIGQHFPFVPDLDPAKVPRSIEGSARWICTALLPTLIYKFLRLESSGRETSAEAVRANYRLVQLMSQLREREKRLGLILSRATEAADHAPTLFGGCYLAASGRDAAREQAFVSGVVRRLIDNQGYVSWTNEVLQDDGQAQRWTLYGYAALGGFVAILVGLVAYTWWK